MELLRKALKDYFKYLEKHRGIINGLINAIQKPVGSLKNFSEQLDCVKRAEINDMPIGKISHIKENLIFKIKLSLEDEVTTLQKITDEFQTANTELEKKLKNVQKYLLQIGNLTDLEDQQSICFGSADCPSILQMIEWTQDSWRFYHSLYTKLLIYLVTIQSNDGEIYPMDINDLHSEELNEVVERSLATTRIFREQS